MTIINKKNVLVLNAIRKNNCKRYGNYRLLCVDWLLMLFNTILMTNDVKKITIQGKNDEIT